MKRLPLLLALLGSVVFAAVALRSVDVRTDMAAFLPAGRTAASRFMLQELQSGSVASLILLGIEGAPPAELARISAELGDGLDRAGLFTLVSNGRHALDGPDGQSLFEHRYLLSPGVTPGAFSTDALRMDLQRLLQQLQSSASPLAVQFGLPDPTGAFLAMAPAWIGASSVRSVGGVWFAPERERALLVVQTRAAGMDIGAQEKAADAIAAAFAATHPGTARLVESGPAVFAREAASSIRSDVRLLSVVSGLLVVALLLWRFRSLSVLAAIAVPVVLSVAVAALVVQAVFGFVHGIALGFGMTMLGVTVDYPVLLIGHRKAGEPAAGTLHRIGRAFALAVACATLGLSGMVFAGFPGIAQLGLFAATGVLAAAAATRLILPRLIVAANLAPVWSGDTGRLLRIEQLRRYRVWGLLPVIAAAAYLAAAGGPRWEGDVANLSPVPRVAQELDATLRRELGAPDLGNALVVSGATAEAVLTQQEALLPAIVKLQDEHAITGFEAAARLLPSAAVQRSRQQALPDTATLRMRLTEAAAGLPFQPDAFAPFEQAVAAARSATPVTADDLGSPAITARLHALLYQRDGTWFGPIAFEGVSATARLTALRAPGAVFVDMHAETNRLVSDGAARAGWWLLGGAAAALLAMLAGLRQPFMVARIAFAIAAAGVLTVALLTAAGVRLSLLHLVALQFTAGVGLDYALFYARRQLDAEERARTLRTLVTCNAMTLLTFGLLACCRTPLLQVIGVTVAIGAVSAMCFSFLFVGLRPHPDA
jgi:predicted exporter